MRLSSKVKLKASKARRLLTVIRGQEIHPRTRLNAYQVVEHSHESLILLLPDLPLGLCRGTVAGRLWDPWTGFVFRRVQHHQIVWASSAGHCSHLDGG